MPTRVLLQPGAVRVSRPGQDVYSAAERDLLLSLNARSCQIIQRGYASFPSGSSPGQDGGISVANFSVTIPFPGQASVPDVWVALVGGGAGNGANNNDDLTNYKPAYSLGFGTGSFTCGGRWQYTTAQYISSFSLIYVVFRKRLSG